MLAYVRKFTYLSAAKNSNKEYLTYGKGKHIIWENHSFRRNLLCTSKAFYALSLDKVINGTLGVRSSTYNGYQWDEIMSAMSDVFLCGGDCVEDVNRSECHLRESPEVRIPTSHTIGRAIKELSHGDMNFFSCFVRVVSSVFTSLSPTSRIKKFVFHFTAVCAKWTRTARSWWLNLYTGMPYDKLSFG